MKVLIDFIADFWSWSVIWFLVFSLGPWLLAIALALSPFVLMAYWLFKAIAYLWKAYW